jgi:hypothetical protein
MSKTRVLLVVVALTAGLMPVMQAQAASDFSDVPSGVYYETAVDWLVQEGITTGTSATTFSPDDPVTRGQMATFLWRYDGEPATVGSGPFTDVLFGAYYFSAVLWLVQQGITTGTSATTFSPDDPVTRGQMATFLWRYAGKPAPAGASPFTDVSSDAYYAEAVAWLVGEGITTGTSATTFSPDDPVTRGQMAAFLWRYAGEPDLTATTTTTTFGGGGGGGPLPLNITSTSPLADGTTGTPYSVTLTKTGGTAPYTWTVTSGSLPSGLTLDPDTGEISGTPDTIESQAFTVQVEDGASATDAEDFTIDVVDFCTVQTDVSLDECHALIALYDSTGGASWTESAGWPNDTNVCGWYGVTCAGAPPSTSVTELALTSNNLAGTIPAGLADLTNLTYLRLDHNALTGSIPGVLGGLSNVDRFNLSFNALTGPIPTSFSGLTSLVNLNLNNNHLSGVIPDLSSLANLSQLNLYYNDLDEALPSTLGSISSLTVLNLQHNQLPSTIPDELGNLTNLTGLFLNNNQLTGQIPSTFTGLSSIEQLDLSTNGLSGPVPDLMGLDGTLTELLLFGQTGCLTATSGVATWIHDNYDPIWNDGCVVTISTASPLPDGTTGTPYSVTLTASGGTGTYTWTVTVGTLPSQLSLDPDTGEISGTPDTVESQTFTVTVTDDNGTVGTKEFTLDVVAPPV